MKKQLFILVVSGVALVGAVPVHAQGVLDHLMCFRMQDPLQIHAAVDMIADLQPEFTEKGCTLVKPIEFCVPATKTNVQPPPTVPNLIGQPLHDDYICYLAKCAGSPNPSDKNVTDQFGTRLEKGYKPFTICVPARKAPALSGGQPGSTKCAGACPVGATCGIDPTDKMCRCLTPPHPCAGKPDKFGVCGGPCPAGETCVLVAASTTSTKGVCQCAPPPPPLCGLNPATGTCGGQCPDPADKCALDSAGNCTCQPAPCGLNAAGQCGGDCPTPTDACVSGPGGCICQPSQCGKNPTTNTCGGPCPPGETCSTVSGTNQCGCQPQPCGSDPLTGTCGGACPPSSRPLVCGIDPATNSCRCTSPCGPTTAATQCGGSCPNFGQTCQFDTASNACTCSPQSSVA